MSEVTNTYEKVKAVILSAHKSSTTREKVNFYNSWAPNYDQVWKINCRKMPPLKKTCFSSCVSQELKYFLMDD